MRKWLSQRIARLRLIILVKYKGLPCPRHLNGKVSKDADGIKYSHCIFCGEHLTLKKKTLGEIDHLAVTVVNSLLPDGEELPEK